jgi:hypothetical protein
MNISDADLIEFAREFRDGILEGRPSWGWCFAISAPLSGLLNFEGIPNELVESDLTDHPDSDFYEHSWIRLEDGRVLDATFDQFGGEDVYLGEPTTFHLPSEEPAPSK